MIYLYSIFCGLHKLGNDFGNSTRRMSEPKAEMHHGNVVTTYIALKTHAIHDDSLLLRMSSIHLQFIVMSIFMSVCAIYSH